MTGGETQPDDTGHPQHHGRRDATSPDVPAAARAQPSRPPSRDGPRPSKPSYPRSLQPAIDTLTEWEELGQRPWVIALLLAIDDGPTTSAAAHATALAWAQGRLPELDLAATVAELVGARLAIPLGGQGEDTLLAVTSAGRRLLDRFEQAARDVQLMHELVDFAETCILHGRLLQLSDFENRILSLVVNGRTDQQIADTLRVSRSTVSGHVQRLLRRLGMRSRNVLIARLTIDQAHS
jgi:DNA-binding CsgD family transcriptional regulator